MEGIATYIEGLLADIQETIFEKARTYRDSHITEVDSYADFKAVIEGKGGFVSAYWDGTGETEERIKEETKATIRCIPLNPDPNPGACVLTGKPAPYRVLFAKAY